MENSAEKNQQQEIVNQAVTEGSAYEVLSKRLQAQGTELQRIAQKLNNQRINEFGSSRMEVSGRVRIRTENNCIARDIVRVGDCLLLGYNVFIGLKKETSVSDVFSLYRLKESDDEYEAEVVAIQDSFLNDPRFVSDFNELYSYFKDTKLVQMVVRGDKLLAGFQIGERYTDMRVFRWSLPADGDSGHVQYIDNRGERDIALPSPYDFEWLPIGRDMLVNTVQRVYLNILDTLFIEQQRGTLVIKLENNTPEGQIICSEKLEDANQALVDLRVEFAELGSLLLLKILPYREQGWRYFVFNKLAREVKRIDALGLACIQLPEDHGIIFPGGYYLQNGEFKTFDISMLDMSFEQSFRSPNGEDVLYTFYEEEDGRSILLNYNIITRQLQAPIVGHGYARLEDGRMVIFSSEGNEPTRIHPMQIWQTPFYTDEFAAQQPVKNGFFGKVGNVDLVRGISDLYELSREIFSSDISIQRYSALCQSIRRLFDAYHWLTDKHVGELPDLLKEISATAEMVLDEFEKVENIRAQSAQTLTEAELKQNALINKLVPDSWEEIQDFVDALNQIREQRGYLLTIREYRYMDTDAIDAMERVLLEFHDRIAQATAVFLADEKVLEPFIGKLEKLNQEAEQAQTVKVLHGSIDAMQDMANDLDILTGLMSALQIEDATLRTRIVESISKVYARLNQAKARAEQRKKTLCSSETVAQFGAQFQLFSQSIISALSLAKDPEKCDEQLSHLLIQLEELESQFGEHEEYLADILSKREEVLETFDAHKQTLLDERQRKAQNIQEAALRILDTLPRRIEKLNSFDDINAFFASDALIIKLKELSGRLRDLQDSMRADDLDTRLKTARDQAMHSLRDKSELFEAGGNVVKLGPKHRFSVNTQELDITLLPRNDALCVHLTGTEYFEPLNRPDLARLKQYWQIVHESETPELYRAEYLVAQIMIAARDLQEGLSLDLLRQQAADSEKLSKTVRDFAAPRYKEGYEKGIHDHDAALILAQLLPVSDSAGLLRYSPLARALACLFWQSVSEDEMLVSTWINRAKSGSFIQKLFGHNDGILNFEHEAAEGILSWLELHQLPHEQWDIKEAAAYLVQVLASERLEVTFSKYGRKLYEALRERLQDAHMWTDFQDALTCLESRPDAQWDQVENALKGLCATDKDLTELEGYIPEATVLFLLKNHFPKRFTEVDLKFTVHDLMGMHPRIENQQMVLAVDDLFQRVRRHLFQFIPELKEYQKLRQEVINQQKAFLRIEEFKPRPLTSFVRNRLISEVYLPVIGDNLAKQMGTVGDSKRTDLMGMLMLISPPGYGKTTLMEYVAHRLGLIFMKINGPSLGHRVYSLDPEQAPDATSRQELEKLNLALEMGNNVMLYVDDIQHTSSEFLQKFISLCDGTRRIEGVWKGKTRTYDMRGRRFCVVMAGNPYTESGEVFKIPDMLANRADVYNLGETLGGMHDAFALSYIENALTSNTVLAPLANRDMDDVYRFVAKAEGQDISHNDFSYNYSASETEEIVGTLQKVIRVRDLLMQVNELYIASAAQDDRYRTEPAFKLQGSYRNMNKIAEKVSAIMNDDELNQLIDDHYQGEAQLLTIGAEENLLKLGELRGTLTEEEALRWKQIRQDFVRNKEIGADGEVGLKIVAQLHDLVRVVNELSQFAEGRSGVEEHPVPWKQILNGLDKLGDKGEIAPNIHVQMKTQPNPGLTEVFQGIADNLEKSFVPVVQLMDRKLKVDLRTQRSLSNLNSNFRLLARLLGQEHVFETSASSGTCQKPLSDNSASSVRGQEPSRNDETKA